MTNDEILEDLHHYSFESDTGQIVFDSVAELLDYANDLLAKAEQYERIGNHEM